MGTEKDYIIGSLISYHILLMSEAKFLRYAGNLQAYFPAVHDDSEAAVPADEWNQFTARVRAEVRINNKNTSLT
jgi:hypothetical protein